MQTHLGRDITQKGNKFFTPMMESHNTVIIILSVNIAQPRKTTHCPTDILAYTHTKNKNEEGNGKIPLVKIILCKYSLIYTAMQTKKSILQNTSFRIEN